MLQFSLLLLTQFFIKARSQQVLPQKNLLNSTQQIAFNKRIRIIAVSQLKQTLSDNIKTSMKARELERVKILRNVQSVVKQIEIDRQTELDDAQVLEVLQKQLKQRQESLTIFTENGRDDLAAKEQFEIDIINEFMPQQMNQDEIMALVNAEIAEQGATSMRDMGSVMGVLKNKTAGRADPALISKMVKDALQG
jgi:hypothetical protein|tara:strand:+ start:11654 stop:12235 length:582 start_codon:yes stop_codon:yes gene_type:complete